MVLVGVEAYPEKGTVYFVLEKTDLVEKSWCTFELKEGKGLGKVKFITPIKENPLFSGGRDLRKVTPADIQEFEHQEEIEKKAYQVALEKISFRRLPIKLILTICPVGSKRITFYYTAKQRVDFRVLVKDLAAVFKLRIQMQQVGVRDEPQLLRSCGVCGRTVCCAVFLAKRKEKLNSVSLEAARVQNLPLASSKISGVCGRLRCCLNFELTSEILGRHEVAVQQSNVCLTRFTCMLACMEYIPTGVHTYQRSNLEVSPGGRTLRSNSQVEPGGRSLRSNPEVEPAARSRRSNPQVEPAGRTRRSNPELEP